jgi:hypothetical protein
MVEAKNLDQAVETKPREGSRANADGRDDKPTLSRQNSKPKWRIQETDL